MRSYYGKICKVVVFLLLINLCGNAAAKKISRKVRPNTDLHVMLGDRVLTPNETIGINKGSQVALKVYIVKSFNDLIDVSTDPNLRFYLENHEGKAELLENKVLQFFPEWQGVTPQDVLLPIKLQIIYSDHSNRKRALFHLNFKLNLSSRERTEILDRFIEIYEPSQR